MWCDSVQRETERDRSRRASRYLGLAESASYFEIILWKKEWNEARSLIKVPRDIVDQNNSAIKEKKNIDANLNPQ